MENKKNLTNEEKLQIITELIQDADKKIDMNSIELLKMDDVSIKPKQLFSANSIGKITVPNVSIEDKSEARKGEEDIISEDKEISCKAKKLDSKI